VQDGDPSLNIYPAKGHAIVCVLVMASRLLPMA
jgi:hypothetical protein